MTINHLPDQDYGALKNSLQAMMETVTSSADLATDAQEEILKQLTFLSEEISKEPTKRNLTLARIAFNTIPALIGFTADVTGLWESDLAQKFRVALGLS